MTVNHKTKLAQVMEYQGRKQRWLADRLGIHESQVSRYLSDNSSMPEEHIIAAAKLLGIPADWLRTDEPVVELEPAS